MTEMPNNLKELQRRLGETDFACVESGERRLSSEVYPVVKEEYPRLCASNISCGEVCSGGSGSPEWKHRVRTVLHRLADDAESRVSRLDTRGKWHFR